jgi:flagellar hook-associated protein 2
MAAVTLSGFNNIDFSAILEAVMVQERVPFTALGTKKAALQQQNTQLGALAGKLASLQSAADNLSSPDSLSVLAATSSDPAAVGVSTSSGSASTAGVYDLVVTQRAKAQVTASTSTATENEVVATGGTLSLLVGAQPPVNIVAAGSMTLRQLADAINDADAGVQASVVQVTPGNYRLVLTSASTGTENAFTFTSTLAGGSGVTFGGADGTYGQAGDGNAVNAADAQVTVNNVAATSSSNTLTDVVPGVTLTLNAEDPTKTVRVSVSRDADGLRKQVDGFVKAYNDLVGWVNDQRTAATEGKTSVAREAVVRGLHSDLRAAILGQHGDGTLTRLAGVGIGFDRSGLMKVDSKAFEAAVTADPGAVQELFAGASDGSTDGAFDDLADLVSTYADAGGLVAKAKDRIDDQVQNISSRMDVLDAQLLLRRNALQAEFIAADQAMSRLNSQVNSLTALNGQYRLF